MAQPADVNLDELRRRGRRRLVGAIVLALVAAVVVPMLLESDPRPLGEDISVRIPPVDDGKFVSKLNAPKSAPVQAPVPAPAEAPVAGSAPATPPAVPEAPRKSLAEAERSVLGPGKAVVPEPKAPAAAAAPPKGEAPKTAVASPAPRAETKAEPPKVAPAAAPANAVPAKDAHVVQLGAFTDDKGANALAGRLAKAGYPAYVEPVATSRGPIWRVRVGPYATRDAAVQARDRLKLDGHAGIVVQPR
jgi:DedD protein